LSSVSRFRIAAAAAAVALLAALMAATLLRQPAPTAAGPSAVKGASLALANCTGVVKESPDADYWVIPLDKCDNAIDEIDVKSGFLSKWTICGGAKSFAISVDPRTVTVSSDHIHCSNPASAVSVTYIGPLKK
jgi:hypothetical protein